MVLIKTCKEEKMVNLESQLFFVILYLKKFKVQSFDIDLKVVERSMESIHFQRPEASLFCMCNFNAETEEKK